MTLIEIAVSMPILLIALSMLAQMLIAGSGMRDAAREAGAASAAAQSMIEEMRNEDLRDLLALYNADPLDDPNGPGTAPGCLFAVEGLDLREGDPDGFVGEIILPALNAGSEVAADWQIREDLDDPRLGTPRDLNGDAVIDDADHAGDYTMLPVVIVLRWRSKVGPRELQLFTLLTEYYE